MWGRAGHGKAGQGNARKGEARQGQAKCVAGLDRVIKGNKRQSRAK